MNAQRDALAARVRAALPCDGVREISMFGGLAFMLQDRMVVCAHRDGSLLVRIDPGRSEDLLRVPDAHPAVMGADRPMGAGWITVTANGLATDQQLTRWVEVALQHHGQHPAPPVKGGLPRG